MSAAEDISAAGRRLALQGIRKRARTAKLRHKLPPEKLSEIRAALGLDEDEDDEETKEREE